MRILNFFQKKDAVYTGIRYTATGIFGYTYRDRENREVFHITCPVMPNPDISMNGFHQELVHRRFNGQITLFPGVRREVTDKTGKLLGYYELVNGYTFRIEADVSASVKMLRHGWEVYEGPKAVARILRIPQEDRLQHEENGYDMEPFFRLTLSPDASPALLPYIFAIPMLGF